MNTDDLIASLADDAAPALPRPARLLGLALVAAVAATAVVFALLLGSVRADVTNLSGDARLALKFAVTLALVGSAFVLLATLAHPERPRPRAFAILGVPLALLLGGVLLEVAALPAAEIGPALVGSNSLACLVYVPLLGALPLAVLLTALRRTAPTRPALTGLAAGLLAGGIAATAYGTYCPDDSPLFVATWYGLSIGLLALAGAAAGQRILRW